MLNIDNHIRHFTNSSFFGLFVVSCFLFFERYNFNIHFSFEIEGWIIFLLWFYLIFNLFNLYLYNEKNRN